MNNREEKGIFCYRISPEGEVIGTEFVNWLIGAEKHFITRTGDALNLLTFTRTGLTDFYIQSTVLKDTPHESINFSRKPIGDSYLRATYFPLLAAAEISPAKAEEYKNRAAKVIFDTSTPEKHARHNAGK